MQFAFPATNSLLCRLINANGAQVRYRPMLRLGQNSLMRKAIHLLVTVLPSVLIAFASPAQAAQPSTGSGKQTYKWVDDKGVVHYGDHVPSEYAQREQRVLNSEGLEVQKRRAEMSPKESAEHTARQREE